MPEHFHVVNSIACFGNFLLALHYCVPIHHAVYAQNPEAQYCRQPPEPGKPGVIRLSVQHKEINNGTVNQTKSGSVY